MEMKELLQFIELEDKRIREAFQGSEDLHKHILARAVKMSEEVGELSHAVLGHTSYLRKSQLQLHTPEHLADECADVLITTLLLAHAMNVDIEKALETKIQKIHKRYEDAEYKNK